MPQAARACRISDVWVPITLERPVCFRISLAASPVVRLVTAEITDGPQNRFLSLPSVMALSLSFMVTSIRLEGSGPLNQANSYSRCKERETSRSLILYDLSISHTLSRATYPQGGHFSVDKSKKVVDNFRTKGECHAFYAYLLCNISV